MVNPSLTWHLAVLEKERRERDFWRYNGEYIPAI